MTDERRGAARARDLPATWEYVLETRVLTRLIDALAADFCELFALAVLEAPLMPVEEDLRHRYYAHLVKVQRLARMRIDELKHC